MTIQIRAGTTPSVDSSSPYTVAKPTGALAGDFLLASVVTVSNSINQVLPPDGWFAVRGAGINGDDNISCWYKVAGDSEPSTYDFTSNSNSSVGIGILALYSNTGAGVKIDDVETQVNASGDRVYPSVTFTAAGLLVCMGAVGAGSTGSSTPPGGMSEQWDTTLSGNRSYCMTGTKATAGATGTITATGTSAASKCISIALIEDTTDYPGIRFRGSANTGPTSVSSPLEISLTMPSNIAAGDMLIAQLVLTADRTVTTPEGWTLQANLATTGATRIFSKVAIDDDAGATLTVAFTGGSTTASLAVSVFFSPVGDDLTIGDIETSSAASASTHDFPSVTSTQNGSVFVMLTSKAQTTGYELTSEIDMWERYDYGGSSIRTSLFTEYLLATGATGTRTIALTSGSAAADLVSLLIERAVPVATYRIYPSERYSSVVYNGLDVTQYLRAGNLEGTVRELDATSLADDWPMVEPGATDWRIQLTGLLTKEIDDILGKEALRPTSYRDLVITVGEEDIASIYTWEGDDTEGVGAFVSSYRVGPNVATGEIPFRAEISPSGEPVRSTLE